jgi:hypothetical protein
VEPGVVLVKIVGFHAKDDAARAGDQQRDCHSE